MSEKRSITRKPRPSWVDGVRHDDNPTQPSQHGPIRSQQHNCRNGNILRWTRTNNRWRNGVPERKHFRNARLHFLRTLLANASLHHHIHRRTPRGNPR